MSLKAKLDKLLIHQRRNRSGQKNQIPQITKTKGPARKKRECESLSNVMAGGCEGREETSSANQGRWCRKCTREEENKHQLRHGNLCNVQEVGGEKCGSACLARQNKKRGLLCGTNHCHLRVQSHTEKKSGNGNPRGPSMTMKIGSTTTLTATTARRARNEMSTLAAAVTRRRRLRRMPPTLR